MTELLERAIAQLKTLPSDRRKGDRGNDSGRTRRRTAPLMKRMLILQTFWLNSQLQQWLNTMPVKEIDPETL